MRAVRTALIFLSGVAVYASMAACSGGGDTASTSSPSGSGGNASGMAGHQPAGSGGSGASAGGGMGGDTGHGGTAAQGGGGAQASGGGGHASGNGGAGPGSGGASTTGPGSTTTGAGGAGGGSGGQRLYRVFGNATDGTSDPTLTPTQWAYAPGRFPSNFGFKLERVLWDDHRQEECLYRPAADGAMRCLPTDVAAAPPVYTDAACTQRAVAIPAAAPGCPLHVPKYAQSFDYATNPQCTVEGPPATHLYPVGAFAGPDLPCYGKYGNGGACVSANCGTGAGEYAVYAVGNELSPTKFVAGTLTHD